jgi:hypothetical protein
MDAVLLNPHCCDIIHFPLLSCLVHEKANSPQNDPNPSTSHHGTGTPISLPYRNVSQDYYYAKRNATYFPGAKPQTKDGACTPFDARQRGV